MSKAFTAFITGIAIGALVGVVSVKRYYENIAQEEIDSVKETYSGKVRKKEEKKEEENKEVVMKDLKDLAKAYGDPVDYSDNRKKKDIYVEKPYVISPEEFGEMDEYSKISLTFYADGVLTEDDGDELIENVEETVGFEALTTFGRYEDDCVHVRNDKLKCDFEILKETMKYVDILKNHKED